MFVMKNEYLPKNVNVNNYGYKIRKAGKYYGNFSNIRDAVCALKEQEWYTEFPTPRPDTLISNILKVLEENPGKDILLSKLFPNANKLYIRLAVRELRIKYEYDIVGKQKVGSYVLYGHRRTKDGSYVDLRS
jgi:hypothetical protein